jgi:hypothetical protein
MFPYNSSNSKKYRRSLLPKVRKKDAGYYKKMSNIEPFDKEDPFEGIITKKTNLLIVLDTIKDVLKIKHNILIPDQNLSDIADELMWHYRLRRLEVSMVTTQQAGNVLKRALMGNTLLKPFKEEEIYPKGKVDMDRFIFDINKLAIESLVKKILTRIRTKQRYTMHKNMPYKYVAKGIYHRPKYVVQRKEIQKYNGKEYGFDFKLWKPRKKPKPLGTEHVAVPFYTL